MAGHLTRLYCNLKYFSMLFELSLSTATTCSSHHCFSSFTHSNLPCIPKAAASPLSNNILWHPHLISILFSPDLIFMMLESAGCSDSAGCKCYSAKKEDKEGFGITLICRTVSLPLSNVGVTSPYTCNYRHTWIFLTCFVHNGLIFLNY